MAEPHENGRNGGPETARRARLRYVSDADPGIRRRRCGRGFTYLDAADETVRDEEIRDRIACLAIPPAWTEVWICSRPDGHIQATGRDDEGRKQYLYHPRWREARDLEKYRRLGILGEHLPEIRRRVGRDLSGPAGEERAVAGAVRLLDRSAMRVGNEAYADENDSFGVTTLRRRHVTLSGKEIRLRFQGKSGREQDLVVRDGDLAALIRSLRRVPGDALFAYRDESGEVRQVDPEKVNGYLREVAGPEVSAKDFRTWGANVVALRSLVSGAADEEADADAERPVDADRDANAAANADGNGNGASPAVLRAVDAAAEHLGNTRNTAREFYVHPGLLAAFEHGELDAILEGASEEAGRHSRPGFRRGEPLLVAALPRLEDWVVSRSSPRS